MKIGYAFLNSGNLTETAARLLSSTEISFTSIEVGGGNTSTEMEFFDGLGKAFNWAKSADLQYCVFFDKNSLPLDPNFLCEFIISEAEIENYAFAVRAGEIAGRCLTYSPKLPYIDCSIVALNVDRCSKLAVFENGWSDNRSCHFSSWGGKYAAFHSFLESRVPYEEVNWYSQGEDVLNTWGEAKKFAVSPLHFSPSMRILSVDASNRKVDALFDLYMKRYLNDEPSIERPFRKDVFEKEGGFFLKRPKPKKLFLDIKRKSVKWMQHMASELNKTYQDEPKATNR